MNKLELINKAHELRTNLLEKENKLVGFIEKYMNDNDIINKETLKEVIDTLNYEIEQLRKVEEKVMQQYFDIVNKEKIQKEAKISIEHHLKVSPEETINDKGILSSSAYKQYLIDNSKTKKQLEKERIILLTEVKNKVENNEISLSVASKLINDINIAYGFDSFNQTLKKAAIRR